MPFFRRLRSFVRTRRDAGNGLSRRDALIAAVGGATPLVPVLAADRRQASMRFADQPERASVGQAHDGAMVARANGPARTLAAKSLDIYSVNDRGAIGDGKTDNTDAINAAILDVHSSGGGEIIFGASKSVYRVRGPIIIPSNIIINLNGQTLSGDGFNGGTMFTTGVVKNGRLVPNKGTSSESEFVFYSSIRNGMIRNCAIAFDFQNFNVSCSIEDVSTFEVLQFGVFHRCFYMSIRHCSARGPSDPSRPAFSFTGDNNLISLLRVSATMDSGFMFSGGTSSVSMISCSCEGASGSAVIFKDDCLGMVIDAGYWEAIQGTVFDFTRAKVCSVSFRSNYVNYCDTVINDGGEASGSTLFGGFDETNYMAQIGGEHKGFLYRGRMILTCPRNFIKFEIPFSNDARGAIPDNWIVAPSTRVTRQTAFTGRSLSDVRSKSRLHYSGPIPIAREGDVGNPYEGSVDRSRVAIPSGQSVAAVIATRICWRPNSLRATFTLSVSDDNGIYKLFGDIYGDQLVQQDRSGKRAVLANRNGYLTLRLEGVSNRAGRASITGSVQLCT